MSKVNGIQQLQWLICGALLGLAFCLPVAALAVLCGVLFALCLANAYRLQPRPKLSQVFAMGLVAHLVVFHWMPEVIAFFGELPWLGALLCFLLLPMH